MNGLVVVDASRNQGRHDKRWVIHALPQKQRTYRNQQETCSGNKRQDGRNAKDSKQGGGCGKAKIRTRKTHYRRMAPRHAIE